MPPSSEVNYTGTFGVNLVHKLGGAWEVRPCRELWWWLGRTGSSRGNSVEQAAAVLTAILFIIVPLFVIILQLRDVPITRSITQIPIHSPPVHITVIHMAIFITVAVMAVVRNSWPIFIILHLLLLFCRGRSRGWLILKPGLEFGRLSQLF